MDEISWDSKSGDTADKFEVFTRDVAGLSYDCTKLLLLEDNEEDKRGAASDLVATEITGFEELCVHDTCLLAQADADLLSID